MFRNVSASGFKSYSASSGKQKRIKRNTPARDSTGTAMARGKDSSAIRPVIQLIKAPPTEVPIPIRLEMRAEFLGNQVMAMAKVRGNTAPVQSPKRAQARSQIRGLLQASPRTCASTPIKEPYKIKRLGVTLPAK